MTGAIEAAIEGVRGDVAAAQDRIEKLKQELDAARAGKSELEKALKALLRLGEPAFATAPTQELVRPIAQGLLRDNGRLEQEDLYGLVREKLAERKVTASGLGLRMKEVLGEPWARQIEPGVFALAAGGAAS